MHQLYAYLHPPEHCLALVFELVSHVMCSASFNNKHPDPFSSFRHLDHHERPGIILRSQKKAQQYFNLIIL